MLCTSGGLPALKPFHVRTPFSVSAQYNSLQTQFPLVLVRNYRGAARRGVNSTAVKLKC